MKFDEALKRFIVSQEAKGNRPRTVETKQQRLEQFRIGQGQGIDTVTPEAMDLWVVTLRRRGLSPVTINGRIKDVKHFYRWQVERGYISHSPAAHLTTKRSANTPIKAMAMSDLERLIATAVAAANVRDVAILKFIASTGCRVGELAALTLPNLYIEKGEAYTRGKTGWRWVDFNEETGRAMGEWLAHRPIVDHDFVFTSDRRARRPLTTGAVYQAFRRLAKWCQAV